MIVSKNQHYYMDDPEQTPLMELTTGIDEEDQRFTQSIRERPWPLDEIDPKKAKFPCCIVWTPLPIVSWLAPYIGHVGICREDGAVLDFAGSNFVGVDNFAYGAVGRYLQLDREKTFQQDAVSLKITIQDLKCVASLQISEAISVTNLTGTPNVGLPYPGMMPST